MTAPRCRGAVDAPSVWIYIDCQALGRPLLVEGSMAMTNNFPDFGLVRLSQIIGDTRTDPPIPAVIPIGRSTWWAGVRSGRYPQPVTLGRRITAWRVEDIRALVEQGASECGLTKDVLSDAPEARKR